LLFWVFQTHFSSFAFCLFVCCLFALKSQNNMTTKLATKMETLQPSLDDDSKPNCGNHESDREWLQARDKWNDVQFREELGFNRFDSEREPLNDQIRAGQVDGRAFAVCDGCNAMVSSFKESASAPHVH
jgi:hypothetical protein